MKLAIISIEDKGTKAFVFIFPQAKSQNQNKDIKRDIIEGLEEKNISEYDVSKIEKIIKEERFGEKILLVEGKHATVGSDGIVKYRLAPLDKENIDFDKLCQITDKDTLLAEVIPPTKGDDGIDVFGNKIPGIPGKDTVFFKGENIGFEEADNKAYNAKKGVAILEGGDLYLDLLSIVQEEGNELVLEKIIDDSSHKSGIDFLAEEVRITGTVIFNTAVPKGAVISASGNIIVRGDINGATLKAERDILVEGKIKEGSKIETKGDVAAFSIENSLIVAKSVIVKEQIKRCNIQASANIKLLAAEGRIVGGENTAYGSIATMYLGAEEGEATFIFLGLNQEGEQRYKELKKQHKLLEDEITSHISNIQQYKELKGLSGSEPGKQAFEYFKQELDFLEKKKPLIQEIESKIKYFNEIYSGVLKNSINVKKEIFAGVELSINGYIYKVSQPKKHCYFYLKGEEVVSSFLDVERFI